MKNIIETQTDCLQEADRLAEDLLKSSRIGEAFRIREVISSSRSDFEKTFALRFALLRLETMGQFSIDVDKKLRSLVSCLDAMIASHIDPINGQKRLDDSPIG